MSAFGGDRGGDSSSGEMPLHEGHGNRIDASGAEEPIPRVEGDAVGSGGRGNRIGPVDPLAVAPETEGEVSFQVVEDHGHPISPETGTGRDGFRSDGTPATSHLEHHEVANGVVIGRHELEAPSRPLGLGPETAAPQEPGKPEHAPLAPDQQRIAHLADAIRIPRGRPGGMLRDGGLDPRPAAAAPRSGGSRRSPPARPRVTEREVAA